MHVGDPTSTLKSPVTIVFHRVSQPGPYWHIGLQNSLAMGALLCLVGRCAASVASVPSATGIPTDTTARSLQTMPNVLWRRGCGLPTVKTRRLWNCAEHPEPSSWASSITLWQFESVSMKVWSLLRCINGITIRNRRHPWSDNWFARMTGSEELMDLGSDAECQNVAEAKSHFYSECNERMHREVRLQGPVASMSPYVWPSLNLAPETVTMKGNQFWPVALSSKLCKYIEQNDN